MKAPVLSVIIPTYNRCGFAKKAVDSVLGQTYRDFELVVVDDGSQDDTAAMLSGYAERLRLQVTDHAGPSAARNRGIEAAQGDFIAFLDSDDLWRPKKLEKQMAFFSAHSDARICQTRETWIRNGVRVNPGKKHRMFSGWIFEKCLPLCIVSPSSVVIHRSVFERVGLFDESMPACEDYDLWLRISSRYPIYLIDEELIIKYGGHADQQSRRIEALDRLRIKALCKSLEGGCLTPGQHDAALQELKKKCAVYGKGCLKRGKREEAEEILRLPEKYTGGG